jgi:hypothetical protein
MDEGVTGSTTATGERNILLDGSVSTGTKWFTLDAGTWARNRRGCGGVDGGSKTRRCVSILSGALKQPSHEVVLDVDRNPHEVQPQVYAYA